MRSIRIQQIKIKAQFRMNKIHLLAIALLGVLLVNLEDNNAHSIQDSLPALVLDDENTPSSLSASVSESSATKKAPTDEDRSDKEESINESKVIPYKTDKREEQQAPTTEQTKESSVESTRETTSQASSVSESNTTHKPLEDVPTSKEPEKDINVLLANKDDAENDLASPSANSKSNSAPKYPTEPDAGQKPSVVVTSSDEKKQSIEPDSPVDTNKQNDDRLHYSFGNSEVNKPSGIEKKEAPKEEVVGSEIAPEKSTLEKKSEEVEKKPVDEKRDEESVSGKRDQKEEEEEDEMKPGGASGADKELDGKKEMLDDKTKLDEAPKQPDLVPKAEIDSSTKAPSSTTTEQTITTTSSLTTVKPSSTEAPSSTLDTKIETEGKKDTSSIVPKIERPEGDESSKKVEAGTTIATTTAVPSASSSTKIATDASTTKAPKPASVPSILAVALGTALGAAVNPIIGNKSDKKPALVANSSSTTTSTTTKAPMSNTRKSLINNWDRWSTTPPSTPSTSTSGPTRRRPILPSIRRRFRPYNRFSPFPRGGAGPYSPVGGDSSDFSPVDLPSKPSLPSTTNKPSWKRTGSTGDSSPSKPTNSDDEEEEVPVHSDSSNRRHNGNGNRRRHHHHHHHHRQNNDGSSELVPSVPKRKYPHHHSHRHYDRDERPSVDVPSAFDSSYPSSPDFGLFNTGSQAGSGFDLLNPFSGWFDDIGAGHKPQRPPSRAPPALPPISSSSGRPMSNPRPPTAVEGVYDDHNHHEYGGRHDHHHHHGRPHNGRDEYEHDHHHHDCHEHEQDYDYHREPYRPNRPHRDREPNRPPIGGYDDNYTPPGGYGRRPARPYNRRDQAEQERNNNREHESSEASPSLYGGRVGALTPVAPRRIPSIFSPFDSLFGSIDDGLFSLRSSFLDSPLRAVSSNPVHTFDTIVSSPRISKQGVEQVPPSPVLNNKESSGASGLGVIETRDVKPSFPSLDPAENNTNDPLTKRAMRAFG